MKPGRIISALFFCMAITPSYSQGVADYRFVNFGNKDGLLEKIVYCATQDKKGYMWFGTATGLYRYDGHKFKHFASTIDKAGNAAGNILQGILTDDDGNLWLGSFTSLQWYNPEKNTFWQPNPEKKDNKTLFSSFIVNFSKGKYIWLSTNKNYVYRFNKADSSFLSLAPQYPPGASGASVFNVEYEGLLYDVHPEGIYIFSAEGKFVKRVPFTAKDISNAFFSKEEKSLYLATYTSGVQQFDMLAHTYKSIFPENQQLTKHNLLSITKDGEGNFFLGGYSLHVIHSQKKKYLYFSTVNLANEFTIAASKIVNIYTDRENNLWLCGHFGLSLLPWQNSQIKTIPLKDEKKGILTEAIGVYHVAGSDKYFLANTSSSGLQIANKNTGKVSTIVNTLEPDVFRKRTTGIIMAPDNNVFASDGNHFFIYNSLKQSLQHYPLADQNGKPISEVARNVTDNTGKIFIGSENNGFYIWDYKSGRLTHYNKSDVTNRSTGGEKDNVMLPTIIDSKNNVWFTSSGGVYEYRQSENKYYLHAPDENSGVPEMGLANYIAEDKLHHYWITTINNGLYELYFENGKTIWKNYTTNSGIGLPSDFCVKIMSSNADSSIWISNNAGLLRFDPVQKKVTGIITQQNGLSQNGHGYGFNIYADNTLAHLFYGSLNIIDLNSYRKNLDEPVVSFNSVRVLDKERVYDEDIKNGTLNLTHNENFLQFEFASLIYNNGNQGQYAYMLEGVDKGWIYPGQKNEVSYSGLRAGTYLFRVKAANNDGLWGPESVIKIIIRPPFYATWWFISLAVLGLLSALYFWNRFRIQQARKEEKLKAIFQQQIAETEMKALRAQMNPHFIFNSLNSIQKYILKNEHFEASQYLTKFSRLIRLILDHSHQNTIILSSEIDLLKLYVEMESLRFDNKFDYKIETDEAISTDTVEIPSMLIQPYVENAIWHGLLHKEEKGKLLIRFVKDGEKNIHVLIEDNGVGREKAAELKSKQVLKKKSYGMQITENRIAIINRIQQINASAVITDLKDEKGNALGTKVDLHIPLTTITS